MGEREYLIIFVTLGVLLFFLFRSIILWYWKIDVNTESLKRIADSLEKLAGKIEPKTDQPEIKEEL